jgi:hypothetical protein
MKPTQDEMVAHVEKDGRIFSINLEAVGWFEGEQYRDFEALEDRIHECLPCQETQFTPMSGLLVININDAKAKDGARILSDDEIRQQIAEIVLDCWDIIDQEEDKEEEGEES